MGFKRLDCFEQCMRHGFDIEVTCGACGRKVVFRTYQLWLHFCRRGKPGGLRSAAPYFVCVGRHEVSGCGQRCATLRPVECDLKPPPAPAREIVPRGIDAAAWAAAGEAGRKRLLRQVRG